MLHWRSDYYPELRGGSHQYCHAQAIDLNKGSYYIVPSGSVVCLTNLDGPQTHQSIVFCKADQIVKALKCCRSSSRDP